MGIAYILTIFSMLNNLPPKPVGNETFIQPNALPYILQHFQ